MKCHFPLIYAFIFTVGSLSLSCGPRNSLSDTKANGRPVGSPVGLQQLNANIISKFLRPDHINTSTFNLAKLAGDQLFDLRALVGVYEEGGPTNEFSTNDLNPLGLLITQRYLEEYVSILGQNCKEDNSSQTYQLNNYMRAHVQTLCDSFTKKVTINDDEAIDLWRHVIGHNMEHEAEAWRVYLNDLLANGGIKSPNDFVAAAFLPVLAGPDFLLAR